MASIPPSFQYGSQKAEKKPFVSANPGACRDAIVSPASAADLAGQVQRLGKIVQR